ncbi:MAG: TlpA disulfide reductase family protein [Pyrinomonadaceae bacterium]
MKLSKKLVGFASLVLLAMALSACPAKNTSVVEAREDKGKPASDFPSAPKAIMETDLQALDGEDFKISDYEGKVVLVNLWATWCGPCIEEMPYFVKLQEKYGDDGFVMIGLNADEESEALVKRFVADQKLNYKIGWSTQEVADEFVNISKMPGIPQSLLINRKGEMTGMFRGGGEQVIAKVLESVEKEMGEKKK